MDFNGMSPLSRIQDFTGAAKDKFLSMLAGGSDRPILGKDTLRSGRNQYSIPEGDYNQFPTGYRNKDTEHGDFVTGLGLDNMQMRSGSGAEQIPTGLDNEYVEPTEFDPSKLKFNQDVIDTFNPDIPERQQTIIEEPMNPMPMERGEGVTISPLFGKQSLQELERQRLAQALRGY